MMRPCGEGTEDIEQILKHFNEVLIAIDDTLDNGHFKAILAID